MKISVTCETCGEQYEVEDRHAGKTIKCTSCETRMTIPAAPPAATPLLVCGEYALDESHDSEPPTFRTAPDTREQDQVSGSGQVKKRTVKRSKGKGKHKRGGLSESAVSLWTVLVSLALIAVLLAIVAVFLPEARTPVGVALAIPGLLLCLYGYATGVYIAFTEDDLHGWLFLLIPFYAAYYIVSRWDDMYTRVIMVVAGLTLLAIGGRFLESERAETQAVTPEAAANP
jgi:DNA-directed RNA polymerase subunit RPC12/RpoP